MCGRYTLTISELESYFGPIELHADLQARYNIAPTQDVPVIRVYEDRRLVVPMRWGLVPQWKKDPKEGPLLINARGDTVAEKPAFRSALKYRRCLIPADGFFEWLKVGEKGTKKIPYYFRMADGRPFAFAGLWEHWEGPDGRAINSCTIITTDANAVVGKVHDRMPVILPPDAYDTWLDPKPTEAATLVPLLAPYPAEKMTAYAVSSEVNSPAKDEPALIEPAAV
jgi:putative SOS response-associated peptidase YedK